MTLIELLITISIGVLLAALLLSGTRLVMAAAKTAKCSSNLHQLGAILYAYAGDHEQRTPAASGNALDGQTWNWRGMLGRYMDEGWTGTSSLPAGVSCKVSRKGFPSYVMSGFFAAKIHVRGLSALRRNTSTIVLLDGGWEYNTSVNTYQVYDTHSPNRWRYFYKYCHRSHGDDTYEVDGRMNVLFSDLRVATQTDGDGVVTRPHEQCRSLNPWYPDDYCHGQPGTNGRTTP